MPGFPPRCPKCNSQKVIQVGWHDRYPDDVPRLQAAPIATIFAYKCECGLAFTFEVKRGSASSSPP